VYKIDSGRSVRVRSMWVSVSFQIFSLTAAGEGMSEEVGREMCGVNVRWWKCLGGGLSNTP